MIRIRRRASRAGSGAFIEPEISTVKTSWSCVSFCSFVSWALQLSVGFVRELRIWEAQEARSSRSRDSFKVQAERRDSAAALKEFRICAGAIGLFVYAFGRIQLFNFQGLELLCFLIYVALGHFSIPVEREINFERASGLDVLKGAVHSLVQVVAVCDLYGAFCGPSGRKLEGVSSDLVDVFGGGVLALSDGYFDLSLAFGESVEHS